MPEYQRVEKNVKFAKKNFFDFVSFQSGLNVLRGTIGLVKILFVFCKSNTSKLGYNECA